MKAIKKILMEGFERVMYKLTSKRVWALALATFLLWFDKINANVWLVIAGAFLGTKIIEFGNNIIQKK
jgi:hypothetical protein